MLVDQIDAVFGSAEEIKNVNVFFGGAAVSGTLRRFKKNDSLYLLESEMANPTTRETAVAKTYLTADAITAIQVIEVSNIQKPPSIIR